MVRLFHRRVVETQARGVSVGVKTLRLVFRGWVVGGISLRHSKCEWEDCRRRENPPSRVSSEGGVGGGWNFPPSLEK